MAAGKDFNGHHDDNNSRDDEREPAGGDHHNNHDDRWITPKPTRMNERTGARDASHLETRCPRYVFGLYFIFTILMNILRINYFTYEWRRHERQVGTWRLGSRHCVLIRLVCFFLPLYYYCCAKYTNTRTNRTATIATHLQQQWQQQ